MCAGDQHSTKGVQNRSDTFAVLVREGEGGRRCNNGAGHTTGVTPVETSAISSDWLCGKSELCTIVITVIPFLMHFYSFVQVHVCSGVLSPPRQKGLASGAVHQSAVALVGVPDPGVSHIWCQSQYPHVGLLLLPPTANCTLKMHCSLHCTMCTAHAIQLFPSHHIELRTQDAELSI